MAAHQGKKFSSTFLHFAGYEYWGASLLPAIVGTTLPFWLHPPGFSFWWGGACLFLLATLLCHAGFSVLHTGFSGDNHGSWKRSGLLGTGFFLILLAVIPGIIMQENLTLQPHVYKNIFILFGITTLFSGFLYVAPPVRFFRHPGGEIILAEGMGMLPVLGAYLVQVGDLTRTVYIASVPVVVVTWVWVWIKKLTEQAHDHEKGYRTLAMLFPPRIARRYITLLLTIMVYITLGGAVVGRSSLHPLSLVAVVSILFAIKIIKATWNDHQNRQEMAEACNAALFIHALVCLMIALSSLSTILF